MNRKTTSIVATVALVSAVAAGVAAAKPTAPAATELKGAGSSFVAPLVSQWKSNYSKADISYNPVGSGAGIQAISNRSVDFGASDAPLTPDQFSGCHGCVQIPWALSATSIPYNVPGVVNLRITGKLLAQIYLGKITKWNDKRLRAINKAAKLPDLKITPVFRSDSSGTTFNVTDYLSHVSPEFKRKIGTGTLVNFQVGTGAKGSSGVSGKFALPGLGGIKAASATVKKVPKNNSLSIVNPPKTQKQAYPICTFTYVILPLKTSKAAVLKTFVAWAMTTGQTFGPKYKFYPIPKVVRTAGRTTLKRVK